MNHSLENSIPYEDFLRMKAQTIPPHRMKEFLDSLNGKGSDELQQFVHSPISVYQQRNHYFYMDSTDVAGSLLELARPIASPLQHPTVSPGMPLDQHHLPAHHVQLRQGHNIDVQHGHQTKCLQQQLEGQSVSEGQHVVTSNSQERRSCPSSSSQPVKKRKFDLPIEDNYTINQSSLQNAPTTVLALPVQSQQQAYIPLRQELLTVDSSQLYGLVPASTSSAGQLPNVDSWAIFSAHATCPESQAVMHTSVPQDTCGIVQMGEIPMSTSSIKLEESRECFEAKKTVPEKTVHAANTSNFPMQLINVNGNIQIPMSVQSGGRMYQSSKYWDQQQIQSQGLQCSPSDQHLRLQSNADFPCVLKTDEGALFWKTWAQIKNAETLKEAESKIPQFGGRKPIIFKEDILSVPIAELNYGLCLMSREARKHDGSPYDADMLFYLFLCMQKYMFDNNRIDNIFADLYYSKFLENLHEILKGWCPRVNPFGYLISSCIAEEMLWDCKQLGAHSPTTLLFTLMYFNTKYFVLKTVEQHSQLAFSKITKQTRKNPGIGKDKNCTIRFLRLYGQVQSGFKVTEETYVEQLENPDNPLQCPIKLYDFYRFKWENEDSYAVLCEMLALPLKQLSASVISTVDKGADRTLHLHSPPEAATGELSQHKLEMVERSCTTGALVSPLLQKYIDLESQNLPEGRTGQLVIPDQNGTGVIPHSSRARSETLQAGHIDSVPSLHMLTAPGFGASLAREDPAVVMLSDYLNIWNQQMDTPGLLNLRNVDH
ncbi:transcriptional regulator QRICH1 [Bombina bombina]|uniref:transcriptional regulator QRICH1 n=1 Tax=Bombina bombina TaxID=8345 RepID=UPI00235B0CF3|nr:transcriptional regulator QRICH1 [Bombina bombina]